MQVSTPAESIVVMTCAERFERLENAFMELVGLLTDYDVIDVEDHDMFAETFDMEVEKNEQQEMTPQEIDEMFNFMN